MDIETLREVARELLPWEQKRWLHRALEILRRDFWQIGETLHSEIDISVGFPHHDVSHNWFGTCREGPGYYSIFINPTVGGLEALDILVHELVHTVVGAAVGHGLRFLDVAAAIGLDDDGPYAAAEEVLLERLKEIQEILGSYPLVTDCLGE